MRLQHIDLDYALFEKHPTLIYKGMKSACATLSGPKGHGVRISLTGFRCLPSDAEGTGTVRVWNRGSDMGTSRRWKKTSITVRER
ncbi:MAG: hypothetical protein ACLVJ6_07315 [Merdibacter sp.]